MPTRAEIERIVDRYAECLTKGDAEGAHALFRGDAVVRDPADRAPIAGEDGLRSLFGQAAASVIAMHRIGAVRVLEDGTEGAAAFEVHLEMNGARLLLDSIDVFRFDERGRIESMIAYWGPENVRPA